MAVSRIALIVAAAVAALAWTVKALAIWEAGGLGETSLEDVFFGIGFVTYAIAWLLHLRGSCIGTPHRRSRSGGSWVVSSRAWPL